MYKGKTLILVLLLLVILCFTLLIVSEYDYDPVVEETEEIEEITEEIGATISLPTPHYPIYIISTEEVVEEETIEITETPEEITESTEVPETVTEIPEDPKYIGSFTAYAYCSCSKCCGQYASGYTASGTLATACRTIAVDPSIIPLGTEVYIEGYGYYVAEDTGGNIKGYTIDVFHDSHEEALQWGKRTVNIYYA